MIVKYPKIPVGSCRQVNNYPEVGKKYLVFLTYPGVGKKYRVFFTYLGKGGK